MAREIRRRLGFLAIAVSGLLTVGLLFSAPAFAWHSELKDVSASCPQGSEQPRVDFTVQFDTARSGHIEAAFKIGDSGELQKVEEDFTFSDVAEVTFHFLVDNPSEDTTITVTVATFFDDLPEGENQPAPQTATADLSKCEKEKETTPTTPTPTVGAPTPTVGAPSTEAPSTEAPTTAAPTTAAAKAESELPGTGSNSTLPMLIVAFVMLVGGGAALFTTRIRGRHAK